MIAVKGRYDGMTVTLDNPPVSRECEVIVTFLEPPAHVDNGSLAYLFKDYIDDGIREPIVDFGEAEYNDLTREKHNSKYVEKLTNSFKELEEGKGIVMTLE
jgi:hypothetical protein